MEPLMMDFIAWLKGKKTYIIAFAVGVVSVLHASGRIDDATRDWLMALLAPAGVMALRAGMDNSKHSA